METHTRSTASSTGSYFWLSSLSFSCVSCLLVSLCVSWSTSLKACVCGDFQVAGIRGFCSGPQSSDIRLQGLGTLPDWWGLFPCVLQCHLQTQQSFQTQDLLTELQHLLSLDVTIKDFQRLIIFVDNVEASWSATPNVTHSFKKSVESWTVSKRAVKSLFLMISAQSVFYVCSCKQRGHEEGHRIRH